MTYLEIKAEMAVIVSHMTDKGFARPQAQLQVNDNAQPVVWLNFSKHGANDLSFKTFRADTPQEVIAAAIKWVDAHPSKQEKLTADATKAVAAAIEATRAAGMEPEFINPLETMMKKLSENALTDQS